MKRIGLVLVFLTILISSVGADERNDSIRQAKEKIWKDEFDKLKYQTDIFNENDSLYSQMSVRLYFNHFLKQDSINSFSSRFMIKEFSINDSLQTTYEDIKEYDLIVDKSSVMKGYLFRCEGEQMTDLFLHDKDAMTECISMMFTQMQQDTSQLRGLNVYFPDFSFKEKRAMAQFVKSVRIMMDASKDFKYGKTALSIIFLDKNKEDVDKSFLYCLMQEAGDVLFIKSTDIINNSIAIQGERVTTLNLGKVGFIGQLKSHLYLGRYYTKSLNLNEKNLSNFKVEDISFIHDVDYIENTWETYLFILIGLLIIVITFITLYYIYLPFSSFINNNFESVIFVSLIVVLEIVALMTCVFLFMCKEDSFQIINKNPVILFTLPLVLVFIVPFLNGLRKKRKLP